MKAHTQSFKENIKELGRELDSKITYTIDDEVIELGNSELNSITPVFETSLLKSVMRELDIDSNVEIPIGTVLNYKFGVSFNGSPYDYIDYGNYIVKNVEKREDTNSYSIVCYDRMLASMVEYKNLQSLESLEKTFPMTIKDYIDCICADLGLFFKNKNEEFANFDKIIETDLYADLGYTYRDVLDELAQVTASNIVINENDELEIRYIKYAYTTAEASSDNNNVVMIEDKNVGHRKIVVQDKNNLIKKIKLKYANGIDTINERYLNDVNVEFGEKYGPINSIVLSRAAESDNVYLQDEESVEKNGLCELKIVDNQIMNFNNRNEFLPDILEKLNGLEFYTNNFSSKGICYYDVCDKYDVKIGDEIYPCVMFNDEAKITQGLEEIIYTDLPEQAQTDYTKADKKDIKLNQTWIITNKNTGDINALTSRTISIEDNLNNNYYTIEQSNELVQNAATGVTNTFSEAGGNNIFRNTGLWFESDSDDKENNPYEFWQGKVIKSRNDQSSTGNSLLLQAGKFSQEQEVPNGNYSVSFYYQKLIALASAKVTINDRTYELTSTRTEQFYTGKKDISTDEYITFPIEVNAGHLKIEFETNTNNSIEIYDIMGNKGTVKLAYSQNENETTTDTVNISKGITITSSNSDVIFKANADGIRTLDRRDNVITEFTDKGMTTNEATIKNEATIVGILRQRIGDQVWDSFIS